MKKEDINNIEVKDPVEVSNLPKLSHEEIKSKCKVKETSWFWGLFKKTEWL